jgi:hypothetical protein
LGGGFGGFRNATTAESGDSGRMATSLTVTLELRPDGESFTGSATDESGASFDFAGWLGLLSALDSLLRETAADDESSRAPCREAPAPAEAE